MPDMTNLPPAPSEPNPAAEQARAMLEALAIEVKKEQRAHDAAIRRAALLEAADHLHIQSATAREQADRVGALSRQGQPLVTFASHFESAENIVRSLAEQEPDRA